ncbi:TIM barrel protein [Planctomicrobium piriforme]|uniref:Tat (Twin-arginine translocation) pathway signal sequence n=1 Tax=Planctomicrobium piriforme TaxID=1576369 RepID=A0A1I3FHX0_9PLAN|nr:TIM barrel protein [Planctomicrobium piriforme]SFI10794.1 Tat (twin-arginine translocation) pathway signal sequence [Planctomicrobium piriforme]
MEQFNLSRRHFLGASLLGAAAGILGGRSLLASEARPLYKISLAEWSLNRALFGKSDRKLDHLDFAKTAKDEFGIEAVEYVNQFFFDKAKDTDYLGEMKKRAADNGVRSVLIMVDREGNLGDPDDAKRTQAIENHKKWVEAAAFLGCHSVRVNAASAGTWDEQVQLAADGLSRLTQFAEEHNLYVIVENHGGLSSNGKWLSEVMRRVDHPHCGTLPDFGNFRIKEGEMYDRYEGVAELMPFAKAVSAKAHDFDEQGNETHTDYLRMMKIVLDNDYHGFVGIEYEGKQLDEFEGIRKTKALLERVRDELAKQNA